jgi:thiamine biosynthesis lipoprotein
MSKFGPYAALGTSWWVEFFEPVPEDTFSVLRETIDQFEADYSRFKPDSLVGRLNQGEVLIAENLPELLAMLQYGQELYCDSNGVFNILTGGTQLAAGYGQAQKSKVELAANPLLDLKIGATISLSKGALDLGGFGKGWLIDKLVAKLLSLNLKYFLVNGGGDMFGTTMSDGAPIEVYVEHPTAEGVYLAQVPLVNQSLAVSSTFKRQWVHTGQTYNHLQLKGSGVASHVVAKTALLADTIATRLCLSGENLTVEYEYLFWQDGRAVYSSQFNEWLLDT